MWKTLSKLAFIMVLPCTPWANLATEGRHTRAIVHIGSVDRIVDEGITQVIIATSFTMEVTLLLIILQNS